VAKKPTPTTTEPEAPEVAAKDKQGRIRAAFVEQLKVLASLRLTDVTTELNRAVRELLQREGLWRLDGAGTKGQPAWTLELHEAVCGLLEREGLWQREGKPQPRKGDAE
jgi:hypothetical protein